MKEWIKKKEIPQPAFFLILILISVASFIMGIDLVIKTGIHSTVIHGESMGLTLKDKTKALMVHDEIKTIERGDIVSVGVFADGEYVHFVKRIIALPNETIKIQGDKVYINGNRLQEPYAYYSGTSNDNLSFVLEPDEYFIMGDNRCNSSDSREFEPTPKDSIIYTLIKYR